MAKRGRPPKLDDTKRGQILGVLGVGGSMATAAAAVGCCIRTVYNTALRDRKFYEQLRTAHAMHEVKLLKCLDAAAAQPKYWRAAAWKLERIHPARYRPEPKGMVSVHEMQSQFKEMMDYIESEIPAAQYDRIIARAQAQFQNKTFETPGNIELVLDRKADAAADAYHHAQTHEQPPPADAA